MPGPTLPRAAVVGLAAGMVWGVAARGWMRLVSTSPEFSWSGTLLIIGLAGVLGLGVGLSSAARRRRGWRRWLRLAVVPGMVLFAGQGAPLLPAFVVAGPLVGRRHWAARVLALLATTGPAVLLWWSERFDEATFLSAPVRVQVALLVGMPVLATALAFAGHLVWGPLTSVAQSDAVAQSEAVTRSEAASQSQAASQSDAVVPSEAQGQSESPVRARSRRRSDSSLEVPAGPA